MAIRAISPATTITAGATTSICSHAAIFPLIGFRPRGRAFCRPAAARSSSAASTFTSAWSMGSSRTASRRGSASTIGTCRKRCRRRAVEPNVHALFGHGMGDHAPGLKGLPNMLAAIHHLNLAQGRAVQALRAERADLRLGTIISLQQERPSSDSADDRRAAERFDAMWNGACLDPLMTGAYPAAASADFAPMVRNGDLAAMRQPIDWLGVNYYSPMYAAQAPQSLFGAWFGPAPTGTRFTAMGWPVDAGGLTEELIRLRERYGDVALYVTENGACYDDTRAADGTVQDD